MTFYILLWVSLFWALPGWADLPRRVFESNGNYIMVELLSDQLVHLEAAYGEPPDTLIPIRTTPMVAQKEFHGPSEFYEDSGQLETARVIVEVGPFNGQFCARISDKVRGEHLTTACPFGLNQAWKGLSFAAPASQNVYGLGQLFYNPGTADGDWIGRIWDPGVDLPGNNRLASFSSGANGQIIFPIFYALGEELHNFAVLLDCVYKQLWRFNQHPWSVEMWGEHIRWFVVAGENVKELKRILSELTGRPLVPPKKIMGHWLSEFGYDSWDELYGELEVLEANDFPVDGFALDIQWLAGGLWVLMELTMKAVLVRFDLMSKNSGIMSAS